MNDAKSTILIVEDNKQLRESLTECLKLKHDVIAAANGEQAMNILNTKIPDLILLDIMLPFPLDGFSIIRLIKSNPRTAYIPVILMSALGTDDKITQGLELGANDYLVKPVKVYDLLLKIQNLIRLKKQLVQNFEKEILLKIPVDKSNSIDAELRKKFETIAEGLTDDETAISIEHIAAQMSMSVSTLGRWTKKIYGMPPKKYILDIRLAKAEILLRQELGNVKDVAHTVGFNSVPYFCQCFKRKYGKSPKSFTRN
jgi:DNA-binding response OmpR family regulator